MNWKKLGVGKMELKIYLTTILSAIAYLLGGWDTAIQTLCIFVIIDYLSGILSALYQGKLSSQLGWQGLIKKGGIFLVIVVTAQLEKYIGDTIDIRSLVAYAFIINEGMSIIENLAECGVPIPSVLTKFLLKLKSKEGA